MKCKVCQKEFSNEIGLLQHQSATSCGQSLFQCRMCQRDFGNKSAFLQHMAAVHPKGSGAGLATVTAAAAGGNFVTRAEFNSLQDAVNHGITRIERQNQTTHDVLAKFLEMTNGGSRSLAAPVSRQIGNGPQEVFEQQRDSAERSGMLAPSSSQLSQRVVACSGGVAKESSRFVVQREAPKESHARQLGVRIHLPKLEACFSNLKQNDFNNFVGNVIRDFMHHFIPEEQDFMACVLLGMVNGKKYPAHNSVIIRSNQSVFRTFFGELCLKYPGHRVKISNNRSLECSFPFTALSKDPSAMVQFISILRGEE